MIGYHLVTNNSESQPESLLPINILPANFLSGEGGPMLKFFIIPVLLFCITALSATNDNFEIIKDGKTYFCSSNGNENGCYKACKKDGNSFTYCRNKCGEISGCFDACQADGNSFSYCHGRCSNADGSCWTACKKDGNSFSYCSGRCQKGQPQCWDVCTEDGNSFSYCNSRCQPE